MNGRRSGVADRYDWVSRPEVLDRLRQIFKRLNASVVTMWRLGMGRLFGLAPSTIGKILVLHHVGRRSGRVYRTPVNYAQVGNELYCVAAFGDQADWYRNLMAKPEVEAWLPTGRWMVVVEDATDHPDRLDLIREVLLCSGFAAPAFGLFPRSMTDEELAAATDDYRLLHLRWGERIGDSTADLGWVWIVVAVEFVAYRAWRKRKRRRRLKRA